MSLFGSAIYGLKQKLDDLEYELSCTNIIEELAHDILSNDNSYMMKKKKERLARAFLDLRILAYRCIDEAKKDTKTK